MNLGRGHRRGDLRRGDGRSRGPPGLPGGERVTVGDRGTGTAAGGSGADPAPPALEVDHVSASYGPYRALFDVTFSVPGGGVTALIGSNGAGKSTVARVVTGPAGQHQRHHPPGRQGHHRAARLQDRPGRDGPRPRGPGGVRQPHRRGEPAAGLPPAGRSPVRPRRRWPGPTRPFPVLGERRRQHGGTLSGGEQRMLSLAKVLVLPPQLLVADEISLGLAPVVIDAVYDGLRQINRAGHGTAGGRAAGRPGPRPGRHGGGPRARLGGLRRAGRPEPWPRSRQVMAARGERAVGTSRWPGGRPRRVPAPDGRRRRRGRSRGADQRRSTTSEREEPNE